MTKLLHAFDRQSARSTDADGRMRVKDCILSTAEVNPYPGNQIPGWEKLGLKAGTIYDMYRDPDALRAGAATFEGVPIMVRHVAQTAEEPRKDYIGGSVHNVRFDGKHLRGDLLVWDGYAIDLITSDEQSDLSCGYRYEPIMNSGDAAGSKYDGRMDKIQGNHVALVDEGRASDAHVADAALRTAQHPEPSLQGDSMAFPETDPKPAATPPAGAPAATPPAGAPAATPGAAPAAAAAPAPGADVGAALKHIATLLETVLTRLPEAAAPPAAAVMPGAADEGGAPSGEVPATTGGGEGSGFALEPTAKVAGAADAEPELDENGNPKLPAPAQEGTPARGEPTPHGAMDAKSVNAVVQAAVAAERRRAASVEEAKREVRGVLGDIAMDDAGAIYREALSQSGVDVASIGKGAEKIAWNAYRVAAGAAAGVRRQPDAALAMDGKGDTNVPSYMKHVNSISVKG